ncbi:alcohol dehydrogenase catalytic domain-containing protein [Aquamicrobium sp.]|uniref:alcohol dehydrogenase catalytic domain-containing protein n=1 Tax=Aquamicrobium sp. TaxID=1872579 RepID=UPI00349EB506
MRAMVVTSPGDADALVLTDVPMPELRPNDIRIKVEACGVCFHDVVTRNGVLKRGILMPVIPGHEISGIVESVGPLVRDFKAGDRVCTVQRRHICGHCKYCRSGRETSCDEREFLGDWGLNGGYAEYVCVEEDNVAHVPDGIPLDEASVVACVIGTELNAVRDVAQVRPGDRVLVTGAGGGLGIHGIQLARASGAFTIGLTTTESKAQLIRDAGAHEVVVAGRNEDFSHAVKALTEGEGVDVVIDNVGSPLFQPTRKSLAMGGRWIFVGQLTGDFVQLNPAQLFMRDISIRSVKSTSLAQLRDCLRMVALGQVRPVITDRLPLEMAAEAHRMVESGRSTGRILLMPGL